MRIILAILAALLLGACATSYKHPASTPADDQAIMTLFK